MKNKPFLLLKKKKKYYYDVLEKDEDDDEEGGGGGSKDPSFWKSFFKKLSIQLGFLTVFAAGYFFFRKVLPKKYRVKDKTIRNLIDTGRELFASLPGEEDGVGELFSKAAANFESFFWMRTAKDLSYEADLARFIEDLDEPMEVVKNQMFVTIVLPKIEAACSGTSAELSLSEEGYTKIQKYTFPHEGKNVTIYAIKYQEGETADHSFYATFAITKGFDFRKLINLLFSLTDNRLYFHTNARGQIEPTKLDLQHNEKFFIMNEKLCEEMLSQIKKFKEKGCQRSYILYGYPGTGKTTFALQLSQRISGKIIKLDSQIFEKMGQSSARILIENLDCDFIVVDDIDRIQYTGLANFLYTLEAIKDFKNKPTLLATVNNIEDLNSAIIRPGRFDEIIEFALPSPAERKEFIMKICDLISVNLSQKELGEFVKLTSGMSQAYIKEYCMLLSVEDSWSVVKEKILSRKKYMKIIEEGLDETGDGSKENISVPKEVDILEQLAKEGVLLPGDDDDM